LRSCRRCLDQLEPSRLAGHQAGSLDARERQGFTIATGFDRGLKGSREPGILVDSGTVTPRRTPRRPKHRVIFLSSPHPAGSHPTAGKIQRFGQSRGRFAGLEGRNSCKGGISNSRDTDGCPCMMRNSWMKSSALHSQKKALQHRTTAFAAVGQRSILGGITGKARWGQRTYALSGKSPIPAIEVPCGRRVRAVCRRVGTDSDVRCSLAQDMSF